MKRIFFSQWRAMGCQVSVQLEADGDGYAQLEEARAQVEAFEAQLSRFRPQSELMRLNAHAGQWVTVSDVLFENLQTAKHAARLTEGSFNPLVLPAMIANGYDRNFVELYHPTAKPPVPAAAWRGMELRPPTHEVRIPPGSALDLGGIAKGWTAERLADTLKPFGACLVNLGGDMAARGAPEGLPGWEVKVADPKRDVPLCTLWLHNRSVVTSGIDYRRWTTSDGAKRHHIMDPHTGQPAETDVLTVTICHADAATAEAYAKAVLLRGSEAGLNWLQTQWDAAGMVVRHDGAVLATPQFVSLIQEGNLA